MKYFLDCEFHEDGETIDLISIGIVAEDGREFYAVNADCNFDRIWCMEDDWLRKNVMPQIDRSFAMSREEIRKRVLEFVWPYSITGVLTKPQFWGYYCDYDWVAFCQLFGRMVDLPEHFPKYCRDIKQLADSLGNPMLPQQFNEHHALDDARWNKLAYEFLNKWSNPQ